MVGFGRADQCILVLWWYPKPAMVRPTIRHHLQFLEASRRCCPIQYHNADDGVPTWLGRLEPEAIILHPTLLCLRLTSAQRARRKELDWLKDVDSLKIALPQDEYDHSEILDEWLYELGVSIIGTNFGAEVRSLLYPIMSGQARFLRCLTGYIHEPTAKALAPHLKPLAQRPLDIVYRAAHLPYWFGSQGQLKHRIADIVADHAAVLGLRCDISTRPQDTITTDDWFHFLASARTTIGCESGSSVLDRRGKMQARIRWLQHGNPKLTFEEASRQMPAGWDDHRFFAIGPRHLEAVITRTCQVLVEGDYDGVLQPHRHYLPLRRDLANLDEVLHMVRDTALIDAITQRAYEDIYLSGQYGYARFAEKIDEAIQQQPTPSTSRLPWLLERLLLRSGLTAPRLWCGVCRVVSQLASVSLPDANGTIEPSLFARMWRPFQYAKLARLVSGEPLLRSALRRGWDYGITRLLFSDVVKLMVLRRLANGCTPDPAPFQVRLRVSSREVRFESIPLQAGIDEPDQIECDWTALEEALAAGEVGVIQWDHTRIPTALRYQTGLFRSADLWLPGDGIHAFKGLRALGQEDAGQVVSLLRYAAMRAADGKGISTQVHGS